MDAKYTALAGIRLGIALSFFCLTGNHSARAAEPTPQPEIGYANCIRSTGPNGTNTYFFHNYCYTGLFVQWSDGKDCKNWKCGIPIGGKGLKGDSQSIGSLVAPVRLAACRYPIQPKIQPDGTYLCVPEGASSSAAASAKVNDSSSVSGQEATQHVASTVDSCTDLASRTEIAKMNADGKSRLASVRQDCASARRAFADYEKSVNIYFALARRQARNCVAADSQAGVDARIDQLARDVGARKSDFESCSARNSVATTNSTEARQVDPCDEVQQFVNGANCDMQAADGSDRGAAFAVNCTVERLTTL